MEAGDEIFPEDTQQDIAQEAVNIDEENAIENSNEKNNETEQFGAAEQDITDVIEDVLDLESEKAKDIIMGCVGNDKQSFLGAYEEAMKKKQEEDSIKYFEELEKRLTSIDREIQKIFVVGNYEDYYRPHEKAIIYIAGQISANVQENITKKVNGWVGERQAARVMRELETRIKFYEIKYSREKCREDEYRAEIDGIEKSLRKDKFELDMLSKSIPFMEEEMKKADEEAAGSSKPKNPEESGRMARDIKRLYSQQQKAARRINKDSAIFSWKESFYMNMNLARDESEYVFEQLKSHHEILDNMIKDYKKCGIAVGIKEGRRILDEIKKIQENVIIVHGKFSGTLVENARMRGCPPNTLPIYPGSIYHDARDVMDKMRREECLKAYQNLDNIFGRKA